MSSVLAHLLLVDDEQQILRALKPALAAAGYAVATAETGHEAMAYLAGEACDVVILDLGLPDMDGKAVISRIREWSETPILVLSARDLEHEKIAALDLGADDFKIQLAGTASRDLMPVHRQPRDRDRIAARHHADHRRLRAEAIVGDLQIGGVQPPAHILGPPEGDARKLRLPQRDLAARLIADALDLQIAQHDGPTLGIHLQRAIADIRDHPRIGHPRPQQSARDIGGRTDAGLGPGLGESGLGPDQQGRHGGTAGKAAGKRTHHLLQQTGNLCR